jgi:hypothetical protein
MLFAGGVSAVLTIIVSVAIDMVSIILLGRPLSRLVFGNSGVGILIEIGVGIIIGFIVANRILDRREQARINRELEQDRVKYENQHAGPRSN